jgi:hypothetical protein
MSRSSDDTGDMETNEPLSIKVGPELARSSSNVSSSSNTSPRNFLAPSRTSSGISLDDETEFANSNKREKRQHVRVPITNGFNFKNIPESNIDKANLAKRVEEVAALRSSTSVRSTIEKRMKDNVGFGKKKEFRIVTANLNGRDKF